MRRAWPLALLPLLLVGCQSCGGAKKPKPAGPRERELVASLFDAGASVAAAPFGARGSYEEVVAELEKQPASALAAIREREAPRLSREALVLKALDHRMRHRDDHRAKLKVLAKYAGEGPTTQLGPIYPAYMPELVGIDAPHFWAERLMVGGDTERKAAIQHLDIIGTPVAVEALATAAADVEFGNDAHEAAKALGRKGEAKLLVEALLPWEKGRLDVWRPSPLSGLAALSPRKYAEANEAIFAALAAPDATAARRSLLLQAVAHTGDDDAIAKLAALRGDGWGAAQKDEIDAAIEAIVRRKAKEKLLPNGGKL